MISFEGAAAACGSFSHSLHCPDGDNLLVSHFYAELRTRGHHYRPKEPFALNFVGSGNVLRIVSRTQNPKNMTNCVIYSARSSSHQVSSAGGELGLCEGPSCIFVGPLETAERDLLEALYKQARDSYYSGRPLVIDDMYDKVETQLRWRGSKLVFKYPRCSLKRFSAYGDVEDDPSQVCALACIWYMLLGFGIVVAAGALIYALKGTPFHDVHDRLLRHGVIEATTISMTIREMLATIMSIICGAAIGLAAVRSLQNLSRGDLVAIKGCCPNCCEEVYAFVKVEALTQHGYRTKCHVCEQALFFQIQRSFCDSSNLKVYGRVYSLVTTKDLIPTSRTHEKGPRL